MKIYFKCLLESDIVLNASLATEGNMKTLDYIPGSNFLGIAARHYENWKNKNLAYAIFHSGDISFGDAHLTKDGTMSYAMPFSLSTNKLDTEVSGPRAQVWVHHVLQQKNIQPVDDSGKNIRLKQYRKGYLNINRGFISRVDKNFALKSAYDRGSRKSLDTAMFGFESMKEGQEFIFSINIKDGKFSEENISMLIRSLEGKQRIGKSKSAQYGQVNISKIKDPKIFRNKECQGDRLLIYAETNLCFYNNYGQPTFQPSPEDFGLTGLGNFIWAESQVRTYSYSPWNGKRGTTDPQRDCIQKGSVLVFKFNDSSKANNPTLSQVGGFQAEGLGRIIYNPDFLKAKENGRWDFMLQKEEKNNTSTNIDTDKSKANYKSSLGKFLLKKYSLAEKELAIGKAVLDFIDGQIASRKTHSEIFKDIPTSQWGGIRAKAFKIQNKIDLIDALFGSEGALTTGVAADKYWNKKNGLARTTLQTTIQNNSLGSVFVVKLATEMAKWKQEYDKSKNQETINS